MLGFQPNLYTRKSEHETVPLVTPLLAIKMLGFQPNLCLAGGEAVARYFNILSVLYAAFIV